MRVREPVDANTKVSDAAAQTMSLHRQLASLRLVDIFNGDDDATAAGFSSQGTNPPTARAISFPNQALRNRGTTGVGGAPDFSLMYTDSKLSLKHVYEIDFGQANISPEARLTCNRLAEQNVRPALNAVKAAVEVELERTLQTQGSVAGQKLGANYRNLETKAKMTAEAVIDGETCVRELEHVIKRHRPHADTARGEPSNRTLARSQFETAAAGPDGQTFDLQSEIGWILVRTFDHPELEALKLACAEEGMKQSLTSLLFCMATATSASRPSTAVSPRALRAAQPLATYLTRKCENLQPFEGQLTNEIAERLNGSQIAALVTFCKTTLGKTFINKIGDIMCLLTGS